jgi:integrase
MALKPTGGVVEHIGRDGRTYRALRFTACGKRRFESLGPVSEGDAQRALRYVLDDVERGIWRPPQAVKAPPELEPVPTFHEYAEGWWLLNESRLAARTVEDYRWRLKRKGGLIDCFGELPLDKITVDTVESFIAAKLGEDEPLSPRSINMMLTLLAAILDSARERKMIEANPATGKRRRVRERKPQRSYLDSAAGIKALLDAAATLGAKARDNGREGHVHREALTTVLVFAGLRVSELCDLLWRHVDLAVGWLHVVDSKTDTGVRRVKIRGIVHDALLAIKPVDVDPDAYVFATSRVEGMNVSFVQAYTVPRTLPRAGQERVRGAFSASDPLW